MAAAEPNSCADTKEEEERERGTRSAAGENDSPSASTPNSTPAPTPCDLSASGTLSDRLPTPDPTPTPPEHPAPSTQSNSAPSSASTPSENRSDFDSRNILPEGSKRSRMSSRRQNYAAALAQTTELTPFYAAFAAGHEKSGKIDGLHRDTLPAEPRSWKQMTKHKFAAEFKLAADREIQELARRETFKWVNKEAVTAIRIVIFAASATPPKDGMQHDSSGELSAESKGRKSLMPRRAGWVLRNRVMSRAIIRNMKAVASGWAVLHGIRPEVAYVYDQRKR
ncbi:hypothetical protein EPUS_06017 [Endocarpon pusillum Z07020]|uniref:Uncharacterized protein n=1 Tax=Endocarpon pusillum (strain Z07020 / HMAS-L-300199) TaxID=1263415 RepID=U1GGG3_ENDPU|nr:uncharacterized protein EPUS_06017 [Endocarpon pusillum Z07020]ERF71188.1 hypothetical protein EPUS_06017 [Endocarpon pusillum Z07020]